MNAISKPILPLPIRTVQAIQTLAAFTRECVASDMPDLSARQSAILLHARLNPGLSVKDFAEALGVNKPYVTRSLDRLADLGLVQRGAGTNPADLRLVAARLTLAGREYVEAMAAALRGAMS